jgi:solute carrier family 13 (sodium-dependent dicarboxylate transporter), member 2/3/5
VRDQQPGTTLTAWIGRALGPVAAFGVHLLTAATDLSPAGRTTAAVAALMAVWWTTEAVPLPVTSLLPVVLFPVLGVGDLEATTRPYANDVIFLFGGGFVLAEAVQRWDLHERVALHVVRLVGTAPRRLVGGFMLATALLSMWVSNTAAVVMMLPIGLSMLALVGDPDRRFAAALMLSIAYAASIGSVATIIGTPPNGILVGYLAEQGRRIGFGQWMLLGVPLAIVFLAIAWLLLTRVLFRLDGVPLPGSADEIRDRLDALGPLGRGERNTLGVFVAVASLWILRPAIASVTGLSALTDAGIAIAGAVALFLIPVDRRTMTLDWAHAKRLPWEVIILFGGGLSLATAIERNGVAASVGDAIAGFGDLDIVLLIVLVALMVVFLTEISSNTATAAVLIPVLAGAASALDIDAMQLIVPATLVATFAFMLPVATPPNAIVFGSGRITIAQMARTGFVLNLVGVALSTAAMLVLVPRVFPPA